MKIVFRVARYALGRRRQPLEAHLIEVDVTCEHGDEFVPGLLSGYEHLVV